MERKDEDVMKKRRDKIQKRNIGVKREGRAENEVEREQRERFSEGRYRNREVVNGIENEGQKKLVKEKMGGKCTKKKERRKCIKKEGQK